MNTHDILQEKSEQTTNHKMKLEYLKELLRIKAKDRKEDSNQQIYELIRDFSILPQYFCAQNVVVGQIQVEIENINKIISSKMEYMTLNISSNFKQQIQTQMAIYLLLQGSIKVEKQIENDTQNKILLKEFKKGDYFSFYDLEYQAESAITTIQRHSKLQIPEQNESNDQEIIEVGCIFLQDLKGTRQNQESEQKLLTKSQFILNFYDNIIKKEISLLKLNYGFISNLNDRQIGQILFHSKIISFSYKDTVYLNNDVSEYMYIVRKGSFCVLWRDYLSTQQRQSIILSHLASESQQIRRWPLRIYESKDIFGEDDIINNCRKRCFDIICESSTGQLIAIPKNYFLNVLYPLLQTYFDNQVQSKEKLINDRIIQIRNQQSKPFNITSPSLQSTQPISRECKEHSLESSFDTIDKKETKQQNSSQSQNILNLNFISELQKQDVEDQNLFNNCKIIDENGKFLLNSQIIEQIQSKNERIKLIQEKDHIHLGLIQDKSKQIQEQSKQKQDQNMKVVQKNLTERKQENIKKIIYKNANIQNLINSISCPNKEDSDLQQDSINQIIKLHQSLIKQSKQTSTKNIKNNNLQEELLLKKQKDIQIHKQQSETTPSLCQIPQKLKSSNSLQNVYSQQPSWHIVDQLNNNPNSPQKNHCHQQNISENYQQSTERRTNKKLQACNNQIKRQINRISPNLDKAVVQQSSSGSTSQGNNNSGGCFNFLSVLASSHQMSKSVPRINQSAINSKSNCSISFNSSKTSNNQQSQSNFNTFGDIYQNQQITSIINQEISNEIRKEQEVNNKQNNSQTKVPNQQQNQQLFQQSQQQLQQQQQQQQQQQTQIHSQQKLKCFSNMVYSKIKEKEDMRKSLKKEYTLLKKKGNLNALSDYSFKLGNYKIKSELLSNSYENLKQIQMSHIQNDNSLIKLKRRFSGDENILANKPKYLFTAHQNTLNKFSKNNSKYLLNKIVDGIINGSECKNQFLNNPLQKDVKVLLTSQSPPLLTIEKHISDQSQKPSITQRAAKINNSQQNIKNQNMQIDVLSEPFELDISPLNQNKQNFVKQLQNSMDNKQLPKFINTQDNQKQDPNQGITLNQDNIELKKYTHDQQLNQKIDEQQQLQHKQQFQQKKYNNFINLNNVYLNKAISGQASLQLQTKLQYYKQNMNSSARSNQGILKQLLNTPANQNQSQQISQNKQQQTLNQLTNNSNSNFNNSNHSFTKQHLQQNSINEQQNEFFIE